MAKGIRRLVEVIHQILEIIPEDREDLRDSLLDIQGSVVCAAPEMMGFWWGEAMELLMDKIDLTEPWKNEPWEIEVNRIFCGRKE